MEAQPYDDDSVTSDYGDDDFMEQVAQEVERIRITGMNVLPRIGGGNDSDDTWEAESFAADSMVLAKLRLAHLQLGYEEMDDASLGASSLGQGSAAPRGRSTYVIPDEDDWTISSECNDSIGLMTDRLGVHHQAEQQSKISKQPLARVTRRRASMDNFVQAEQLQEAQPRETRHPTRRMSVSSASTVEESLSSHGSGGSEDPSGNKRGSISRHKSMPYVKSKAPLSTTVPMWPNGPTTPRQKMARRVSNGGTPCAA
jgi:hypothetical protein